MRTLALSYNISEPFSALMEDGRQVEYIRERDYYEVVTASSIFPDNAVKRILSLGSIDSVVFLGKPLPYLENLILLHRYLFPGTFSAFMRDVSDYFNKVLAIPKFVNQTQNDIDLAATKSSRKTFYYVKTDDALACNEVAGDDALIITCLTDVFEGCSFCCFERKDNSTRLAKESNALNSFSNLLKIYNEAEHRVDLSELIETSQDELFRLKKRYFSVRNNSFAVKDEYLSEQDSFEQANDELLLTIFSELMLSFKEGHDQIVFMTDCPVPSNIVEAHCEIVFKQVDDRYKVDSAGKYLFEKVNGAKAG